MRADCSYTGMGRVVPYLSTRALLQCFHLHLLNASHTAGSSMDHTCTSGLVRLWDADYSVDLFNFVTGFFNLVAGIYFMEHTAFCTGTECTCIKRRHFESQENDLGNAYYVIDFFHLFVYIYFIGARCLLHEQPLRTCQSLRLREITCSRTLP